jgi:hypothetical protein
MNGTLELLITIFVACAAIALVIQACMLVGLFVVARRLLERVTPLLPEIKEILGISRRTVARAEAHVEKIGAASTAILESTKGQLSKIDALLTDATQRAKIQMDRAELVLDDTMNRVQETVTFIQSGVVRPVREVYGILAGIRTTLAYLGRSRRPTVDHATSDEEMFI